MAGIFVLLFLLCPGGGFGFPAFAAIAVAADTNLAFPGLLVAFTHNIFLIYLVFE
jgi:hypothetical protein